jgi:hypothetical protein
MMRTSLCALLLAFTAGCMHLGYAVFGVGSTESPRWNGVPAEKVWVTLQEAVSDYYDIRLADDEEKYLETEWSEHLGPMYKSGRRYRARVRLKREPETGAPYLEVTVDRQINTNMSHPLSKEEADWQTDWDAEGRDLSREKRIVWLVNFRLKKIAPSKKVLKNEPSEYSRDPEKKAREDLWGKEKEKDKEEKDRKDLWK